MARLGVNALYGEKAMTDQEYLERVLKGQDLTDDSAEMRELREHRQAVERHLRESSGSAPGSRYVGSKAKGTLNKESFDLDMTCYFPRDDESAGQTLQEVYESVERALQKSYRTRRKGCAIRILDAQDERDFHVDVVPGRFVEGADGDVFLYPSSADKERLKTNLDKHIEHVKSSGVVAAIRLLKLWKARRGTDVKTFALELLTIDQLERKKDSSLPEQLKHVWTQFRDRMRDLQVQDPANREGNDLTDLLDSAVRQQLEDQARATLDTIKRSGWEAVFSKIDDEDDGDKGRARVDALRRVAAASPVPAKPWCDC